MLSASPRLDSTRPTQQHTLRLSHLHFLLFSDASAPLYPMRGPVREQPMPLCRALGATRERAKATTSGWLFLERKQLGPTRARAPQHKHSPSVCTLEQTHAQRLVPCNWARTRRHTDTERRTQATRTLRRPTVLVKLCALSSMICLLWG